MKGIIIQPLTAFLGSLGFSLLFGLRKRHLFAASLVATIPVVILFMSIEKHLTSGLTSGGVKG